ncbi:hypothetical protein GLOTRDRAFT_96191 [Gloeophyllum trabeum ATCC 11539]|uniref:Uncharacterized protein n=1 Tax=Gloeophyllum trabeum (strain ATCC 11539 / FP-39264 / Madison 617) TaxID=670483 RepID=S7PV61_GLOTA|nr:uncharacterized protein GLOTRDRAFT_96191 [Gloeophyllum trabeum ATCC 11539]EPQ51418.1 hypothetical protein GLOTRDRAFT_96191 [Gloeophyllum trabeum ATCC 11539]
MAGPPRPTSTMPSTRWHHPKIPPFVVEIVREWQQNHTSSQLHTELKYIANFMLATDFDHGKYPDFSLYLLPLCFWWTEGSRKEIVRAVAAIKTKYPLAYTAATKSATDLSTAIPMPPRNWQPSFSMALDHPDESPTLNPDGSFKDASEISWVNSPTDELPPFDFSVPFPPCATLTGTLMSPDPSGFVGGHVQAAAPAAPSGERLDPAAKRSFNFVMDPHCSLRTERPIKRQATLEMTGTLAAGSMTKPKASTAPKGKVKTTGKAPAPNEGDPHAKTSEVPSLGISITRSDSQLSQATSTSTPSRASSDVPQADAASESISLRTRKWRNADPGADVFTIFEVLEEDDGFDEKGEPKTKTRYRCRVRTNSKETKQVFDGNLTTCQNHIAQKGLSHYKPYHDTCIEKDIKMHMRCIPTEEKARLQRVQAGDELGLHFACLHITRAPGIPAMLVYGRHLGHSCRNHGLGGLTEVVRDAGPKAVALHLQSFWHHSHRLQDLTLGQCGAPLALLYAPHAGSSPDQILFCAPFDAPALAELVVVEVPFDVKAAAESADAWAYEEDLANELVSPHEDNCELTELSPYRAEHLEPPCHCPLPPADPVLAPAAPAPTGRCMKNRKRKRDNYRNKRREQRQAEQRESGTSQKRVARERRRAVGEQVWVEVSLDGLHGSTSGYQAQCHLVKESERRPLTLESPELSGFRLIPWDGS